MNMPSTINKIILPRCLSWDSSLVFIRLNKKNSEIPML